MGRTSAMCFDGRPGTSTRISRPLSRPTVDPAWQSKIVCIYQQHNNNSRLLDAPELNRARFLIQLAATQSRQTRIGIKQTAIPHASALVAVATPEKLWCQTASKGSSHKSVAARLGANP